MAEIVGCEGYAIDEIINGLFNSVLKVESDKIKAVLLETLAKTGEQLELGACELPLVSMMTKFYYVLNLEMWTFVAYDYYMIIVYWYFKLVKNKYMNKYTFNIVLFY